MAPGRSGALAPSPSAPAAAAGVPQAGAALGAPATAAEPAGPLAEGPLLDTGVDMQEVIDSVRASIEIASRQGIATARIALEPEQLGQIRIHLTQTRDGLIARVSADSQEAAKALMAGRSDLAESLRSLGTSLLSLDINAQSQPDARGQGAGAPGSQAGAAGTGEGGESQANQAGTTEEGAASSASPRGTLVDVLV